MRDRLNREHQVPRGVPPLRAGGADRGRGSLLRAAAGRRAARALHVGRVPGAAGVARAARRDHARRRHRARADRRARHGAALSRAARTPTARAAASRSCSTRRSTWPASRSSTAPSRATRPSAAAASTCSSSGRTHRDRGPGAAAASPRRRSHDQAARQDPRGCSAVRERGPVDRRPRARALARERGKRWMVPLVVFLCVTGLILAFAATRRGARAVHLHDLLRDPAMLPAPAR